MGDPHLVGALLLARDLYPEARFVLLGDDALARLKVRRPRGCPLDALAFGLNQGRSVRLLGARRLPEAGSTVAGLYDLPPVSP